MLCSKFPTVTANFNLTAFLGWTTISWKHMESSHSELCKHENERDRNMLKNSFSALLKYLMWTINNLAEGYTLTEPVAVPMASNRRAGSQAKAVGLFGNPCCTVWNKIKIYYYNIF
jgi:hypothetical protein